jgi:MFS family permease
MPKRVWAVVLITFVNALGYTMLVPVFPYIVDSFGGKVFTLGFLIAAYPLFAFFAAPFFGSLSDRFGRRPILLLSFGGTLVAWGIFILGFYVPNTRILIISLPLLIMAISRIIDGVTGGNGPVTNAYIVDSVAPAKRTAAFGMLGVAIGIGFIVGPMLGSYLGATSLGFIAIAFFAMVLSICSFLFIYFYLPESLPKEARNIHTKLNYLAELNVFKKLLSVRSNSGLKKLFFLRVAFSISFAAYSALIVVILKDSFGVNSNRLGILFLFMGIAYLINQGFILRIMVRRLGDIYVFYLGQLLLVISCFLFPFANTIYVIAGILFLANMGLAFSFPTFKTIISDQVSDDKKGEINGIDESFISLSNAIGPLLAGALYTYFFGFSYILFGLLIVMANGAVFLKTGSLIIRLSPYKNPIDRTP